MGLITGPTFTSAGGGQRESQRLEESERLDMKDTLLAGFEVGESHARRNASGLRS